MVVCIMYTFAPIKYSVLSLINRLTTEIYHCIESVCSVTGGDKLCHSFNSMGRVLIVLHKNGLSGCMQWCDW